MRMVVTGREGQIVRSLLERAPQRGVAIVPLGRPQLELSGPEGAIISALYAAAPDVIVSAAAYTQVDKAETERELAFAVNEGGARAVGRAASALGVPLIHLSTDYVFDGAKEQPYVEGDPTGPSTVYGASKLAGEQAVLAEHNNSVILRTAWVYSPFGANFVRTMLRLARERKEVTVVADQRGNPTSALDIADAILTIATNLVNRVDAAERGVFHMTASGDATWAEFAAAIFGQSGEMGGPAAAVRPTRTTDYPTEARRPANSRLDSSQLLRVHGVSLPEWQSSLRLILERLMETGS